ncbi:hypothetical protein [Streptomyces griseoaurantiacus]|uniref:hypothetical protein n=1 Tax=Streptomyces griseoaurantiacus TaxID=68213 RepID=UPI0034608C12
MKEEGTGGMGGAAAAGDRGALSRLRVGRGRRAAPRRRQPGGRSCFDWVRSSRWHDPIPSGQARRVLSVHPQLVGRVRHALQLAGFHIVDEADDAAPGLRVSEAPGGVLVSWTTSHGFTALAADQRGASSDGMWVVVQAAMVGLLVQGGHMVVETPDGNGIVVLADGPTADA